MIAPNNEDSSVMDVLLAMAAKLERTTMANETGCTANMDWEWTVGEHGCPAEDDVKKDSDSGSKRPARNEQLPTIVEEDESSYEASTTAEKDEDLTMPLE